MTGTPTQTVRAFLDAFARHDVDAAMAVVDPRVSVTVHPLAVHGQGADALRTVLADLVRGFPDLMIRVGRVITTGDVVTALFKAEGTRPPITPAPSTPKSTWISTRPGGS